MASKNRSSRIILGCLHVAAVLAPILLVASRPGAGTALFALLWTGLGMSGLLNLMHECAHGHFFGSRSTNDAFGRALGALFLADFDSYRSRHWDHHRRLGEPDDPKYIYRENIRGFAFVLFVLRCLTGLEAATKLVTLKARAEKTSPAFWSRVAIVHGLWFVCILGGAYVGGRGGEALGRAAMAYALYLYALASLTTFAASLRAIAEHQPLSPAEKRVNGAALRNFGSNPLSWAAFGAYGFSHHASHHLEPGLPCSALPEATRRLAAADPAFAPRSGYVQTLASLVTAPPTQT